MIFTKIGVFIIVLLTIALPGHSQQNLIRNPDFSEIDESYMYIWDRIAYADSLGVMNLEGQRSVTIPNFYNGPLDQAKFWTCHGSVDYFNTTIVNEGNVYFDHNPERITPFIGNGVAGAAFYNPFNTLSRMYLIQELECDLTPGVEYGFSMHVKFTKGNYLLKDFGAVFMDSIYFRRGYNFILSEASILNKNKDLLKRSQREQWHKINGKYLATGEERFIVIGVFGEELKKRRTTLFRKNIERPGYYFIDDVRLIPGPGHIDCESHQPIAEDSRNNEYVSGHSYTFQNIHFYTDSTSFIPSNQAFEELNTILKILVDNPGYKLFIEGHTDDVGNENYNLRLSRSRAGNVKKWFVMNGINPERVTARGKGSKAPLVENSGDDERQLNRRVEFRFVK